MKNTGTNSIEQFEVYKLKAGETVVILQHSAFDDLSTRIVAPLIPKSRGNIATSLNPILRMSRRDWVLAPQLMGYISASALQNRIGSLADQDYAIKRAIDQLFLGV